MPIELPIQSRFKNSGAATAVFDGSLYTGRNTNQSLQSILLFFAMRVQIIPGGSRHSKDYFWCIDPLDGTLPFINARQGACRNGDIMPQPEESHAHSTLILDGSFFSKPDSYRRIDKFCNVIKDHRGILYASDSKLASLFVANI